MEDKVFKTHDEQLDILKNRGIDLENKFERKKAKNILQREGYYKLINGYKTPFLDKALPGEKYLPGTTVSQIHALYVFDRNLREIFLRYILHVETNIKSLMSYVISENYGHDNYLLYRNFNTAKKTSNTEIPEVIAGIQQAISKNSSDPCIRHYLQNYGYIPMWVLNNVLTFGTVGKIYSIMKTTDRQSISRKFKVSDNTLESFIHTLSMVRNCCAHGNRLYCYRNKRPLIDTPLHSNLCLKKVKEEYEFGKRDLFSAVIALKYLVSVNEYKTFEEELEEAINQLDSRLKVISIDSILEAMGFPPNWKDVGKKNMK